MPRSTIDRLTDREIQVLDGLSRGLRNKQIAAEMGLSPLTIKSHLARISQIMQSGDRAGMVGLAYRSGLLKI